MASVMYSSSRMKIPNLRRSRSLPITDIAWKRSASVVECLTRDRGAADSIITGVTAFCHLSKNINPSLVLVQPRKPRPFLTERLLMGRKKSNQTNKQNWYCTVYLNFKHSYEQTATEPARYYGTYPIGEQPWIAEGST